MFSKKITAVVLAGLIGARGAAIDTLARHQPPQQEQQPGPSFVLLDSKIIPAGNLTTWGVPDNHVSAAMATVDDFVHPNVSCGTSEVSCNDENPAYTTVCSALIASLVEVGVSNEPQSLCLTQNGFDCCISWAKMVPGLIQTKLYDGAKASLDSCGGEGSVSAVTHVNLGGVCTNQCLASRPEICV